jgi:hypothetical protein
MTAAAPGDAPARDDNAVIDAALAAIRDARLRAPREYLLGIAGVLALVAVALLGAASLTSGGVHDLLLNLGAEVIGACLTLLLIDGLWQRLQVATSATLDAMTARLTARRGHPLSTGERAAWTRFADEYASTLGHRSLAGRLSGVRGASRRLDELEAAGNRTLAEFRSDAEEALPSA